MMKTVLYLSILGLMVHWAQGMVPGERRSIQTQVHQEQSDPKSDESYSGLSRPKRWDISWDMFSGKEVNETELKIRLNDLDQKYEKIMLVLKKLLKGEPIGEKRNKIENCANSGSMESVEANEGRAMPEHSESNENKSFGSLGNLESSEKEITKNEREVMNFLNIEINSENDSVDPTNMLLSASQSTSSAVITNDPLTKISLDHEKDETNIGLTNKIMVTESNADLALMPNTVPTKENNFPQDQNESYQRFSREKESAPILVDNNESSVQDFPGDWESLAITYSNPSILDTKGREIKGTQVSHENQDAAQDTDDQIASGFDHASPVEPSDIFGEFLSSRNEPGETRMEQKELRKDFERVHQVIHNFEENKDYLETLSYLAKKNKNKDAGPYGVFRSLNKLIELNPLVAEADKIFRIDTPPEKCTPCQPMKQEEKMMCVLTPIKEGGKKETSQKDQAPSTPSVTSTPATDTKGTATTKKREVTEKPVVAEPEKTKEKEPEETEQKEPEKTEEKKPEKTEQKEPEKTDEEKPDKTEEKKPEEPDQKQI